MKLSLSLMVVMILLMGGVSFGYNRNLLPSDFTPQGAVLLHSGDTIRMQGNCYIAYDRYSVGAYNHPDQYVRWHISGNDSSVDAGYGSGFVAANAGCADHPAPNYQDSNMINDTVGTNLALTQWSNALSKSSQTWVIFGLGIMMVLYLSAVSAGIGSVINLFNIFNRGDE